MHNQILKITALLCAIQIAPAVYAAQICGDLNGDGYADLAITNPSENFLGSTPEGIPALYNAGAVHVMFGTEEGLLPKNSQFLHQDTPGVLSVAEAGEWFGYSLAAGDFNGDKFPDLAVGAPSPVYDGGQIVIMSSNHAGPTGGPWTTRLPPLSPARRDSSASSTSTSHRVPTASG